MALPMLRSRARRTDTPLCSRMAKSPEGNEPGVEYRRDRSRSSVEERLTQFVRELVAEDGHRCSQAGPPGQREGRAHRQPVRKVVDPVADSYHERQNSLSWGGGSRRSVAGYHEDELGSAVETLTSGALLLQRALAGVAADLKRRSRISKGTRRASGR